MFIRFHFGILYRLTKLQIETKQKSKFTEAPITTSCSYPPIKGFFFIITFYWIINGNWSTQEKTNDWLQDKIIYPSLNHVTMFNSLSITFTITVTHAHTLRLNTLQMCCVRKLSNLLTHYVLTIWRKIKECSSH